MDPQEKEARQMIAAELVEQGDLPDSQIAASLEVTTQAVNKWHQALRAWRRAAAVMPGLDGMLEGMSSRLISPDFIGRRTQLADLAAAHATVRRGER